MNLAIVTVVGQCVGANRYDEAEHYLKKMMKVSWIATAVLTVLVWLCLPMILSCFAVSEETYHYAYILVMLHNIFATVLHPTSFNLPNGLRAAGDAKFTMYIGIGSMAMFRHRLGSFVWYPAQHGCCRCLDCHGHGLACALRGVRVALQEQKMAEIPRHLIHLIKNQPARFV